MMKYVEVWWSAYTKGKEHMESMERREEKSALWRHCKEKYNAVLQEFKMAVTGVYSKDAMLRQIAEGVRINKVPAEKLIN